MMSRNLLLVAVTGALAGWLPGVSAQTQKNVVLTNGLDGQSVTIPLDHTQPAGFNSAGDFVAACKLNAGVCPNVGSGGGSTTITNFPTFSLGGPSAPVTAAGAALSWSATNAHVCYGVSVVRTSASGPAAPVSTWGVSQPIQGSYSLNTLFNSVGAGNTASYEFTLRCYSNTAVANLGGANLQGVGARDSKITVTLSPPTGSTPGADACTEYYPTGHAAHSQPGFQAPLTRRDVPFNVFATFSVGGAGTPVTFQQLISQGTSGQTTLPASYSASGEYVSVVIDVPADAPNGYGFSLLWAEQQDFGTTAMPTSMEISLSPCAGDFRVRPANNSSPDYWDRAYCRRTTTTGAGGPMYFSTGSGTAPNSVCWLPKGKRVYLNMSMHNMNALRTNPSSTPISTCQLVGNTQCGYRFDVSRITGY